MHALPPPTVRHRSRHPLAALLAAVLAPAVLAQAPPPTTIDFQARLTDNLQQPLTGPHTLTARLYDVATGGNALWTEGHAIHPANGVVNVTFGTQVGLPVTLFEQGQLWLSLQIDGDAEMTPRRALASVPFSFRASRLDRLDASTAIDPDLIANEHLVDSSVDSSKITDGSVGIGDLGTDSVDSNKICNGSVGLQDLGSDSVDATKICDGSVGLADLATDSVDSFKICNGSVGVLDLGDDSVNSDKICDSSVTLADLDPTGASAGQVLEFDGANLVWGTDDVGFLTLPFTATSASGDPLFEVHQTGPGAAAHFTTLAPGPAVPALTATSAGPSGVGVHGEAVDGSSIENYGVRGDVFGSGAGVFGEAHDKAYGVHGVTNSNDGFAGVFGEAHSGGVVDGVLGFSESSDFDGDDWSAGVRGRATRVGVEGECSDPPGGGSSRVRGRLGYYDSEDPWNPSYGVWGAATDIVSGTDGYGVFGRCDADGNNAINAHGVHGSATTPTSNAAVVAVGVYGTATGPPSAVTYGVYGRANTPNSYGVYSQGDYGGVGAKYFVQPHPEDAGTEIRYVCLEGPESGTYFRGAGALVGGTAVIEVPDHFRHASEAGGVTVQLTPVGAPARLWVAELAADRIVVHGDLDAAFHYTVNGVRRGFAGFEPVRENHAYVPRVRGVPYGAELRDAQRRILVENGTLEADFTPNEATAARLGWTLREPTAAELAAPALAFGKGL